jgi:hypothetical protein
MTEHTHILDASNTQNCLTFVWTTTTTHTHTKNSFVTCERSDVMLAMVWVVVRVLEVGTLELVRLG